MVASVLAVIAIALTSHALGGRLLRGATFDSEAERFSLASAVGAGLVGTIAFAIGLVGGLYSWLILILLGAGVALSWRSLPRTLPPWWMIVLMLATLMVALRPPTTLDATLYHLGYVRHYAQHHRIEPVRDLRFPVFPQLNEVLFTIAFIAGGEPGPALVELWLAAIAAAAIYALVKRSGSHELGLVAAALWLGNPMVQYLSSTPYVDVGVTAFVTVAALALIREDFGLAGLLVGFAAGAKYLGLLPMAIFGLFARKRVRYGLFAIATAAPFYLYNWIHTGNPIVFGVDWSAADRASYDAYNHAFGMGHGPLALALLPWNLTFHGARFSPEEPWLPLLLPSLILIAWRKNRQALVLFAMVCLYTLVWFFGVQVVRYLLPVSGLFCVAVALSLPRARTWMAALLLMPGTIYCVVWLAREGNPFHRESYLARNVHGYSAIAHLNRAQGDRYHLYGLTFDRLHYFADGELIGDWLGRARYAEVFAKVYDPAALHDHLRALGADHYLVECPGPHLPDVVRQRESFTSRFEPVLQQDGTCLFRLK